METRPDKQFESVMDKLRAKVNKKREIKGHFFRIPFNIGNFFKKLFGRQVRMITKLMIALTMLLAFVLLAFSMSAFAEDAVPESGFLVTSPRETGAVGFWFPRTGTKALGVSHTVVRVQHSAIKIVSLDLDGTVAQEVSERDNNKTLAGIGIKANFNVMKTSEAGFSFLPSTGITALNDFKEFNKPKDIIENYELAVYGTLLMYRW